MSCIIYFPCAPGQFLSTLCGPGKTKGCVPVLKVAITGVILMVSVVSVQTNSLVLASGSSQVCQTV